MVYGLKELPAGTPEDLHLALTDPATANHEVERLAYFLWRQRGCPAGSAEEDWFAAETKLQGDH
jgi:hypothetical protein